MWRYLVGLLLLSSCMSSIMTSQCYEAIQSGESITSLEKRCGLAYEVVSLGEGTYEYHYIERIEMRPGELDQVDYYITVKEGRVVGKRKVASSTGLFNFKYNK